jgi:hypothetical protein
MHGAVMGSVDGAMAGWWSIPVVLGVVACMIAGGVLGGRRGHEVLGSYLGLLGVVIAVFLPQRRTSFPALR